MPLPPVPAPFILPVPPTGSVGLLAIYQAFGAPPDTPLTAMVKGGAYVPSNVVGGTIPTAPPIAILNFAGSAAPSRVVIANFGVSGDVAGSNLYQYPPALSCAAYVSHVEVNNGGQVAGVDCTVSVMLQLDSVPSPKLIIRPRATNPIDGATGNYVQWSVNNYGIAPAGAEFSGYQTFIVPDTGGSAGAFLVDNPAYPVTNRGDCEQFLRGCFPMEVSPTDPEGAGTVLTTTAAVGNQFTLDFAYSQLMRIFADSGDPSTIGQVFTWAAAGFGGVFSYDLCFLDGTDQVLQRIPLDVEIAYYGSLTVTAVSDIPP